MKEKKYFLIVVLLIAVFMLAGCQESEKSKYEKAQSLMAKEQYAEAGEQFSALGSYEESAKLAMYCKAAAAGENGEYSTAISTFSLLGDYKESTLMSLYYTARSFESFGDEGNYPMYKDAIKIYDEISLFRDSAERADACRKAEERCRKEAAELEASGDAHLEKGEWEEAVADYYESIARDYTVKYIGQGCGFNGMVTVYVTTDCSTGTICSVSIDASGETRGLGQMAMRPEFTGQFVGKNLDTATNDIDAISGATVTTKAVKEAFDNMEFATSGFYPPCDKILNVYYQQGIVMRKEHKWDEAANAFTAAGLYNYSDAEKQLLETRYAEGTYKRGLLDWDGAILAFSSAENYEDAKEQVYITQYAKAEWLIKENRQAEAAELFASIAAYKDSMERAKQIYASVGDECLAARDWDGAVIAYKNASGLQTASAEGFGGAVSVTVSFDMSGAIETLSVEAGEESAWYGQRVMDKEYTDQFIGKKLPMELGKDVDALSGATITSWAVVEALNSLTGTCFPDDVIQGKLKEAYYQKGKALDSEGKYTEAFAAFNEIQGYKDVDIILAGKNYAGL